MREAWPPRCRCLAAWPPRCRCLDAWPPGRLGVAASLLGRLVANRSRTVYYSVKRRPTG